MFHPPADPLPPPMQVMAISMGSFASQALYTAAELRLADLVQEGTKSTAELARATGTHEDNLSRLLREDRIGATLM